MSIELAKKSSRRTLTADEEKWVKLVFMYVGDRIGTKMEDGDLDFLISVQEQYEKDGRLSDKQLEVMEKIFSKY